MATKKAASTKKATAKPAAAKTTVRTVRADDKSAKKDNVVAASTSRSNATKLPKNIVNIVFAELVGTFILTVVALATFQETGNLYVGLALTMLVMAIGNVSGAHVNPAVTFGLWSMRRLKSILLPFYWVAQLLGAMLAVIVINWVSHNAISLNFSGFSSMNWGVFGAELVATAVFLFGIAAVTSHRELTAGAKALGIGISLTLGLVAGTSVLTFLKTQDVADYQSSSTAANAKTTPEIPHSAYVKGVTANPAVAIAVTDHAANELVSSNSDTTTHSRFTLEVILGTLVGAALGGNLYLLIAGKKNS